MATPFAWHARQAGVFDVRKRTVEGAAPEKCPLCGAPKERFIKF